MGYKETGAAASRLAPGQSIGGEPCPRCGHAESFSIFATDDGRGWKCHRAKCGESRFYPWDRLNQPAKPVPGNGAGSAFKPRPYPFPTTTPGPGSPIWPRLDLDPAAVGGPALRQIAAEVGVQARLGFENEVVWTLRDFDFNVIGHVSRDYETKTVRTWRLRPGPIYGYFSVHMNSIVVIVEDCVSAARLARRGVHAMALLGTHMTAEARHDLEAFLRRQAVLHGHRMTVKVALDPDASDKAFKLATALTIQLGYGTMWFPTSADPKDMGEDELEQLIRG